MLGVNIGAGASNLLFTVFLPRGGVGTDILKRRNSTSYPRLVWTSQLPINHRTVRQWLTPMGKYEPAYELLHFCHGFHRQYNTYQRGFRHCLSSKEWQCEGQNKRDGQEPESRAFYYAYWWTKPHSLKYEENIVRFILLCVFMLTACVVLCTVARNPIKQTQT